MCLCISVCPALNLWFIPGIPEASSGGALGASGALGRLVGG